MDYYLAAPHFYLEERIYVVSYLNFDGNPKGFLTVSEGPNELLTCFRVLSEYLIGKKNIYIYIHSTSCCNKDKAALRLVFCILAKKSS